jgi:dephospho-CoA kinase
MKIVAISGGIGSGKSTVRQLFQQEGAVGIDTDQLARQAVAPGSTGAKMVAAAFGPEFFNESGELDRQKMARLVFGDPIAREKLESILHPIIRRLEKDAAAEAGRRDPDALVVVEVPLLAEGGRASEYDAVINVTSPEDVRIRRLVEAGRYRRKEAKARIAAQTGDTERLQLAAFTIENSGTEEETLDQVKVIISSLKQS